MMLRAVCSRSPASSFPHKENQKFMVAASQSSSARCGPEDSRFSPSRGKHLRHGNKRMSQKLLTRLVAWIYKYFYPIRSWVRTSFDIHHGKSQKGRLEDWPHPLKPCRCITPSNPFFFGLPFTLTRAAPTRADTSKICPKT